MPQYIDALFLAGRSSDGHAAGFHHCMERGIYVLDWAADDNVGNLEMEKG